MASRHPASPPSSIRGVGESIPMKVRAVRGICPGADYYLVVGDAYTARLDPATVQFLTDIGNPAMLKLLAKFGATDLTQPGDESQLPVDAL